MVSNSVWKVNQKNLERDCIHQRKDWSSALSFFFLIDSTNKNIASLCWLVFRCQVDITSQLGAENLYYIISLMRLICGYAWEKTAWTDDGCGVARPAVGGTTHRQLDLAVEEI